MRIDYDGQPPAPLRDGRHWKRLAFALAVAWLAAIVAAVRPVRAQDRAAAVRLPRAGTFVGNAACVSCHQDKAAFAETAHAATSRPATAATVRGGFQPGANTLRTANPDLYFIMKAEATGPSQTAVLRTSATQVMTRTERMDLVVGSGRKGQSYLFWDGNELFQLPVSYWAELGTWVNSPGYVDGRADFERPIPRRCLECHATAFESRAPPEHAYEKSSLIPGIACEKCHGPGSAHAALQRSPSLPALLDPVVNPRKLARQRQIDACALCHAGAGTPLTPPLSFRPGDDLAKHLAFAKLDPRAPLDVHANQVQLLERSRCFQASGSMTCSTCHDVHRPQRDLGAFSNTCLTCHQIESCGKFPERRERLTGQCVACHMPAQATDQIVIASGQRSLQPKVRNHHIAIHPGVAP